MILLLMIILAVLIWLIQREIDRTSQEAIQVVGQCSGCHALIEPEWLVCPHCKERLSESCDHCHKSKLLNQPFCPHCGGVGRGVAG